MKRVKVFSSISQFESFINNPEYSIIDVKVDSCEQSSSFQECFIGVVFYEDAPLDNNESAPSTSSNSDYKKFSGSDIKNAYVAGYETGHNDTVESCYGCSEDKVADYLEEPENFS